MQRKRDMFVTRLVEFADQGEHSEFVIPEDLSVLSDSDLTALHAQAVSHFDALYGDGTGLAADDVSTLGVLTEGIETLAAEVASREALAAERSAAAAELASRIHGEEFGKGKKKKDEEDDEETMASESAEDAEEGEAEAEAAPEGDAVTASGRREIRVPLGAVRNRSRSQMPATERTEPRTMRDVMRVADVPGFTPGEGLDWQGVGRAIDRRLAGLNASQYAAAARSGRHLREQHGVAVIHKPFDPALVVQSSDPAHVDEVLRRAMDESRLPGGSLVASGGWCAPSETLYSLFEIETRDGLFSLPEIGIARGGINFTPGPTFSDIYSAATGWNYTEAEDEDGDYNGEGGGSKPVYTVGCPDFTEERMDLAGLAIQAGLLQQRGYPEMIARTVRGALVAHDHRMAGRYLGALETGSTAVTMPDLSAGATAPLLEAIELQVEHYRYIHRLGRGQTLEAVFPFWVRGAIRSDLARRLGVDLISVPNARIDGWFRDAGVNPQFVYNWQDITGGAAAFTGWPTSVKFLLYLAGTWVKGGSDVITLDTIYDSVLLGTNDYTALFTEEGWLIAKMGHDSRVVEVPLCTNGATHSGALLDCDGAWYGAEGS